MEPVEFHFEKIIIQKDRIMTLIASKSSPKYKKSPLTVANWNQMKSELNEFY